ncbi:MULTISPECIES: ABC transporter ATP-binding protein [Nitrosomonas]|uniref:ATP-binding cassette subfamily C protein n=2 Tax=Nitrosomonas eutropha TaxID=916 RepID=A0ABX5MAN8_9PROT|nr:MULTISPECIES: ABC transporter ATP-binding protein [Nitrosomonas]ABI58780.1 ABC transporter-related protein [Nitrosomonas eutropha C91]MXS79673.1 ABC transporter ATP-binding protein [Nitrosomonas sp. GH22]PXV81177.1 ATP-binding cassette subfamily C protein [Nitrosomonas eutropha]SCX03094.1 ATP-binding cassette, subfamily C [Nitrosomonas eutropha]SDW24449.1 ATP-binding cassette, subfamily C [Nitrosomonas eutropha]
MRTLITYIMVFPKRSAFVLIALLLAGVAEALSLTALLPLLSIAVGESVDSKMGQLIVNMLHEIGLEPTLETILLVIVGGMFLKGAILLLTNQQVGHTVAHVATALRLDLIKALLASRWQYYLRQPAGALANSIATEAYRAANGFEHSVNVLALAIEALVYSIVALFISWEATLGSLIIGAILFMVLHRLVRATKRAGNKQTHLLRHLLTYLSDVLGSVKSLKAMARDNVADVILREQTRLLEKATRKEVTNRAALLALQEPILAALTASGLYLALVIWKLSLPEVMVMVFLLTRVLGLLNKTQRRYQQLVAQESAYWALRSAAEEARMEAERSTGTLIPTLEQGLNLRHIVFSYERKTIFSDLNIEIPVHSFTALIGSSGAGKSTLLDLLCGLAEPESGEILIDGVSLHNIDLRHWRHMIGYVSQDTVLLHDTILSNILVGDSTISVEDAERALRQAGAWDFVNSLPDGIHTIVGERGGMLSGGQRQRIAIARALAHQPKLLLLDEPTSALDPESERIICTTLQNLSKEFTIIVVSHQPAVINAANRVFIVSNGKAELLSDTGLPAVTDLKEEI